MGAWWYNLIYDRVTGLRFVCLWLHLPGTISERSNTLSFRLGLNIRPRERTTFKSPIDDSANWRTGRSREWSGARMILIAVLYTVYYLLQNTITAKSFVTIDIVQLGPSFPLAT